MRHLLRASLFAVVLCLPAVAEAQVIVHTVALTTDSSGDVTAYTRTTRGTVLAIRYVPDATTPLATGADLTVTDNVTGLPILTYTNIGLGAREWTPRTMAVTTTGAVATFDGTRNILDLIPVANAIKVVIAQGGATKSGTLYIYVLGS